MCEIDSYPYKKVLEDSSKNLIFNKQFQTPSSMMARSNLIACFLWMTFSFAAQTVSDIDGNNYTTVVIGNQTWMQQNLKTTRYANGIAIPTTANPIVNDSSSVFQWAYNNDPANIPVYGRLYTWYAVARDDNVCPLGWHVPDASEWQILCDFLGGDSMAGAKMKETGTVHWSSTSPGVTNSSLFTALPGGFRGNSNIFNHLGNNAEFWSSSAFGMGGFQRGYWFGLSATNDVLTSAAALSSCGMAVRCIKDLTTGVRVFSPGTKMLLFPNPAVNDLTIHFQDNRKRNVYLYTVTGILLYQQVTYEAIFRISLLLLNPGLYVVKSESDGEVHEQQFIKE